MSQLMPGDFLPEFLRVIVAFTFVIFIELCAKTISYCLCILGDSLLSASITDF